GTDPARWSPVARVVASQIPALSARARRITACDSRESSKSICKEIALQQPKAGKFDYLSAPGHSAHSMASEFFTDDLRKLPPLGSGAPLILLVGASAFASVRRPSLPSSTANAQSHTSRRARSRHAAAMNIVRSADNLPPAAGPRISFNVFAHMP